LNIMSEIDDEIRLFLNFAFGALLGWIYLYISGNVQIPTIYGLLPVIYVGVFEMGVTFILWNKALKMAVNPAQVNNLIYLSPVISLAFIGLILNETITFYTFLGIFLIIAGILLQSSTSFLSKTRRT
ncbi:MAG: EamA family transporter, partial [Candidatus Kapaibacteriota bacterium]